MKRVRSGCRRSSRKGWSVWVMTGSAHFSVDRTKSAPPIAARTPMDTRFPVAIGWTMTTAAQGRTIHQLHLMPVARLQKIEIRFIVAIETVVISLVTTVPHLDVVVLLRQDYVA